MILGIEEERSIKQLRGFRYAMTVVLLPLWYSGIIGTAAESLRGAPGVLSVVLQLIGLGYTAYLLNHAVRILDPSKRVRVLSAVVCFGSYVLFWILLGLLDTVMSL